MEFCEGSSALTATERVKSIERIGSESLCHFSFFLTMYMESGIIEDVLKICIVVVTHCEYYQFTMWYFHVFQDMPCFHGQAALPVM